MNVYDIPWATDLPDNAYLHQRPAANARRLVEQRYDWDAIGRRFVALVEETAQARGPLSLVGS